MALTFVQANSTSADTTGNNLTVSLTGVGAGNLIVIFSKHEGAATTQSIGDGTDTFTNGTIKDHSNNDTHSMFCWLLSSSAGNKTYTQTLGANRIFRRIHVREYSYTGTASFDTETAIEDTGTALSSGNITTTGTDEVVIGGYNEYSSQTFSSPQINGLAADGSRINEPANSYTATWYKIFTSTFTGAATATLQSTGSCIMHAIAFKATAAISGTSSAINIGDAWKNISGMFVNIGDAWKTMSGMLINIGDAWKTGAIII